MYQVDKKLSSRGYCAKGNNNPDSNIKQRKPSLHEALGSGTHHFSSFFHSFCVKVLYEMDWYMVALESFRTMLNFG